MYLFIGALFKPFIYAAGLLIGLVRVVRGLRSIFRILISDALERRRSSRQLAAGLEAGMIRQFERFPMHPDRKTIFLVITCGQAVRTFLVTETFALLKSRFNLVILSPYERLQSFRLTYQGPGVHVLPWYENYTLRLELLAAYHHMDNSSSETLKSILLNIKRNSQDGSTSKIRNASMKQYKTYLLAVRLGNLFGRRFLVGLHDTFLWTLLPHTLFKGLFKAYKPALVISTAAHHSAVWPITHFAKFRGVKTLANIISWDNLTTKPILDESAGHYALWSEEMRGEMKTHFPFIDAKLHVVGSPQFDIYYNKEGLLDRTRFVSSLGLPPELPYILYTTNTPVAMPEEYLLVTEFWNAIEASDLAGKVSLLIRLHPKDRPERYAELQGRERVCIRMAGPPEWAGADNWVPNQEVIHSLLNQMAHAAVSINVASTMSLESFCLDLPTLNVAYTVTSNKQRDNLLWSFDMYHTSEHYKALIEKDAVIVARSCEELVDAVREALVHGNTRSANMLAVLDQKVAHCDGSASRRFHELVESIVG